MARTLPSWPTIAAVLLTACQVRGVVGSNASADGGPGTDGASTTTSVETSTSAADGSTTGTRLDVAALDVAVQCNPPDPDPCDDVDDDPWHALGLRCRGGEQVETSYTGAPEALGVHLGTLGTSGEYAPREGQRFVVMSTGHAEHLAMTPAELQVAIPDCDPVVCPSTQLDATEITVLPDPIDVRRVSTERDCAEDPSLVGMGDCSNTLWSQWIAGSGAYDYAELRMRAEVPPQTDGLRYDFALFSVEYPLWVEHGSPWNDMYVAWLESESWTGNISFDEAGHAVSVNSVFLDYKDAPSSSCPDPCEAPELAGFAMEGHAGTKWLTTTAPVRTGEEIELVLALFDLSDGLFDTMVILDNFQWTCSGMPPVTNPAQ